MESLSRRSRSKMQALGLAIIVGVALSGCGSDGDTTSGEATTTSSGSRYQVVPDNEVTAGLAAVRTLAGQIETQAKSDLALAKTTFGEMYETWEDFEGTVRSKEKQTYLDLEDAIGGIKLGVEANKIDRVTSGVKGLNTAIDAYLVLHP